MSEVQSRGSSSRGRGAHRGGRGGYRGSRGTGKPHSRNDEQDGLVSLEEQGEVGELKLKYSNKLPLLREVCEGWSDEDLVFALQEVNGDVEAALDRITSGTISQWGEVKKKPTKSKEPISTTDATARGRGRGGFDGRGRGRGTERVARAGRGSRSVSQANGTKSGEKVAQTTEEAFGDLGHSTIDKKPTNGESTKELITDPGKDNLESLATTEPKPAPASAPKGSKVGGWAGLFAKPPPTAAPKQVPPPPTTTTASGPIASHAAPDPTEAPSILEPPPIEPVQVDDPPSELPSAPHSESAVDLTPSKDELTEKNLDKLPDVSHPPASQTVASTTASTQDPMNPAVPTAAVVRPGMSGYAATALKATSGSGRTPSYSRKLMDQQQAVVMPGNHAVDRAAVQFGQMGLNGIDDDITDEREEPETRPQLPDDSPAAPRASLPPAVPETKAPVEAATTEAVVQRGAPGLPPAPQQAQESSPQQVSSYTDQYRYAQGQKAYDPFTQQPPQATATTEPFSNQIPGQTHGMPGAQDYSQYYGGNNRDAYQQYYGAYGQGHDNARSGSAFGTTAQDTQGQYATARPGQSFAAQEGSNSGGNTPNPPMSGHQSQHSQHVPGQNYGGYPYGAYPNAYGQQYPGYGNSYMGGHSQRYGANRPMFDDVRRDNDYHGGNQYNYNHNQQYGGNYKSNMYGQPHQYSHDYSSSPANTSGFGGREAAYGRAGSTQPSESQQTTASNTGFGSMTDPFTRTPSSFGQNQSHNSHQAGEEQSKPSGPSPSLQGNRPGSAINNISGQQGALPHPQSQHAGQGFGGYPQYGAFGNQGHNTGYGGYGSNAGFGAYGGGYGRGWSGSYGGGGGHN